MTRDFIFSSSTDNCCFAGSVIIEVCPTASLTGLYTSEERLKAGSLFLSGALSMKLIDISYQDNKYHPLIS